MTNIIEVENRIITLRGQQVIIDADVAELYGVETKRVNEAVANNPEKFPEGYILEVSKTEKQELVENFDRFNRQKHSTSNPKAFTEKGLYMLATILKSQKATDTTIAIVEAYAKLRELTRVMSEIPQHEGDKPQQAGNERDSTARGRQASTGVAAEAGRPIGGRPAQRCDAGAKQRNHPGTQPGDAETQTHRQTREAGKHVDAKTPL